MHAQSTSFPVSDHKFTKKDQRITENISFLNDNYSSKEYIDTES